MRYRPQSGRSLELAQAALDPLAQNVDVGGRVGVARHPEGHLAVVGQDRYADRSPRDRSARRGGTTASAGHRRRAGTAARARSSPRCSPSPAVDARGTARPLCSAPRAARAGRGRRGRPSRPPLPPRATPSGGPARRGPLRGGRRGSQRWTGRVATIAETWLSSAPCSVLRETGMRARSVTTSGSSPRETSSDRNPPATAARTTSFTVPPRARRTSLTTPKGTVAQVQRRSGPIGPPSDVGGTGRPTEPNAAIPASPLRLATAHEWGVARWRVAPATG